MLAWLPSRPTAVSVHSPLTVSRPITVRPRSVKKAIVASRSRTAMPTFSSLMPMPGMLSSRGRPSDEAEGLARAGDLDRVPVASHLDMELELIASRILQCDFGLTRHRRTGLRARPPLLCGDVARERL